jgi:hypothetical protein
LDSDGKPLPFQDEDSILEFLRTAEVTILQTVLQGTTQVKQYELQKDGVKTRGVFRDVRIRKNKVRFSDGSVQYGFRDDHVFEVAAYRVAGLLGLRTVPPVVTRKIDGENGTLQLWVENCFTEGDRVNQNLIPPDMGSWALQFQTLYLFDNLIYNDDRNRGNILIDDSWRLWMIDHTRSFRNHKKLRNYRMIKFCDREVFERLRALDKDLLREALKGLLSGQQISTLLHRRDLLVEHLEEQIKKDGEEAVLF